MSVFKSYLRAVLRQIRNLKQALEDGDMEKAKEITDQMLKDAEDGLADD